MESAFRIAGRVQAAVERIDAEEAAALVNQIALGRRTFCLGAGRSGLILQAFAVRLRQMRVPTFVVGSPLCPPIETRDLLLIASGSGSKETHRELIAIAKAEGAGIALITAEPSPVLAPFAELIVRIPSSASRDDAELNRNPHQPLNSLFEQALLIFLDAVVVELMARLKVTPVSLRARHANLE